MFLSWHKTGQMVVCIDAVARKTSTSAIKRLVDGDIYTLDRIRSTSHGIGATLVEIPNARGFYIDRFRPVRQTDIEQFRHLLNPTDDVIVEELEMAHDDA